MVGLLQRPPKRCLWSVQLDPHRPLARPEREHRFLVHEVQSPYQAGKTEIRVLPPDKLEGGKRYPVVYVLPVEARSETAQHRGQPSGDSLPRRV